MKKLSNLNKGIILAFLTAIISGVSIFYSKLSVAKIDPLVMATARNMYVGILFFLFMFVSQGFIKLRKLNLKEVAQLVLIGLIGGGIPFYLFFFGIKLIGAQNANMIQKSLFMWVILLGALVLKEKIKVEYILGGILIFAGTYFFTPVRIAFGKGELFILVATLMWAVENIIAKKVLSQTTSELVGLFRMGIGGLLLLTLTFISGKSQLLMGLQASQLQNIFIGGTLLFFYVLVWYKSLQYAPVGLVTAILTFSLVVGNILGGSFIHVNVSSNDVYSMLLIACGVLLFIILPQFQKRILRFAKDHDT